MDAQETTIFLKLGGSLITDKLGVESVRISVLKRLAEEISTAINFYPRLKLIIGHGSGSYGHVAAKKYGTRQGIIDWQGWKGFIEVSSAAARLSKIVHETLLKAGVPVLTLQPSASAVCQDGKIISMETKTIEKALEAGICPLIYGDVAFDEIRGGTIISTEEILSFLTPVFRPQRILLAAESSGVLDVDNEVIPLINRSNFEDYRAALGGSSGTDVTGGMLTKVESMLYLAERYQGLSVTIFSGKKAGNLPKIFAGQQIAGATLIRA